MNEQEKRQKLEKATKGLEHELRNRGKCGHYCREGIETFLCEYDKDGFCIQHWGKDALALLKAQEPRLITEADFDGADEFGYIPVWTEEKDGDMYCECITKIAITDSDDIGVHIRFWTSRPTDTQREEVKWNG